MHTLVSPDQQLQLNAALAVIQWKHAFAVRMRQRTNGTRPATNGDNRISSQHLPTIAAKRVYQQALVPIQRKPLLQR